MSKILWSFGSRLILPKFSSRILISESVELWEVVESELENCWKIERIVLEGLEVLGWPILNQKTFFSIFFQFFSRNWFLNQGTFFSQEGKLIKGFSIWTEVGKILSSIQSNCCLIVCKDWLTKLFCSIIFLLSGGTSPVDLKGDPLTVTPLQSMRIFSRGGGRGPLKSEAKGEVESPSSSLWVGGWVLVE